ncbi:MAG: hypothetical protein RMY29_025730 [Nostoc sp. CreGUA01]|nr:hypothetical protein [Nostoc sp. CreGUA01]
MVTNSYPPLSPHLPISLSLSSPSSHHLPMPNAQCPMPNAQCPIPNAQCPMPKFIYAEALR